MARDKKQRPHPPAPARNRRRQEKQPPQNLERRKNRFRSHSRNFCQRPARRLQLSWLPTSAHGRTPPPGTYLSKADYETLLTRRARHNHLDKTRCIDTLEIRFLKDKNGKNLIPEQRKNTSTPPATNKQTPYFTEQAVPPPSRTRPSVKKSTTLSKASPLNQIMVLASCFEKTHSTIPRKQPPLHRKKTQCYPHWGLGYFEGLLSHSDLFNVL